MGTGIDIPAPDGCSADQADGGEPMPKRLDPVVPIAVGGVVDRAGAGRDQLAAVVLMLAGQAGERCAAVLPGSFFCSHGATHPYDSPPFGLSYSYIVCYTSTTR